MRTNLKKKALLPLIAMVLVSVISLTGVTYAWFTTSNTASVQGLDVQVTAANGIQISLDAVNWTSLFNASAINNVDKDVYASVANMYPDAAKNQFISPVSTSGVVTNGKLPMFKGDLLDTNNIIITEEKDGVSTNYIVFDLFIKMTQDNTVKLDAESEVTGGASGAARVAFVDLGSKSDYAAAQQLPGDGETSVVIWDPAGNEAYKGLKKATAVDDTVGIATDAGFVTNTDYVTDITGVTESNVALNLEEGINKIRVYIWLEGQDAQCLNAIASSVINTKLKFVQNEIA